MFCYRHDEAILTTSNAIYPDHIRTKIRQQRPAERSRDVTPEIDHPYTFENFLHIHSLMCSV
ncbi:hypothetical protein D9M68_517730 [compost metagenome]